MAGTPPGTTGTGETGTGEIGTGEIGIGETLGTTATDGIIRGITTTGAVTLHTTTTGHTEILTTEGQTPIPDHTTAAAAMPLPIGATATRYIQRAIPIAAALWEVLPETQGLAT